MNHMASSRMRARDARLQTSHPDASDGPAILAGPVGDPGQRRPGHGQGEVGTGPTAGETGPPRRGSGAGDCRQPDHHSLCTAPGASRISLGRMGSGAGGGSSAARVVRGRPRGLLTMAKGAAFALLGSLTDYLTIWDAAIPSP